MEQYGIVWNRGVVEVVSATCVDIIEEYSLEEKIPTKIPTIFLLRINLTNNLFSLFMIKYI